MLKRFCTNASIAFGTIFGTIGCSTENQNLFVDKFTLRSIKIESNSAPMIRGDQQKRLYGAVSIDEHRERIGQYYLLRWHLLNQPHITDWNKQAQIIFKYKQASTGSLAKTLTKTYPAGTTRGKWTFDNIDDDYIKGGRILAWHAELRYDDKVISEKQSYLWKKE